ncbi:phosphoribulokinase family protein-related protein [Anaeramoeba ignava]|uniref:Phosphoribulokinase family protein-related protein n=1 Tax=Anaeramoeba ignava TaxID=1746090 RepID=A0A9Q0LLU4_ANAIG|nr:phosphoribulokinase family protein-related protein [Anaeramoeba ignava]
MADKIMRESSKDDLFSLTTTLKEKETDTKTKIDKKSFSGRIFQLMNNAAYSFLLVCAYGELFPERDLVVAHSFGDGYFCHDYDESFAITQEMIDKLKAKMKEFIDSDDELECSSMERETLVKYFQKKNFEEKIQILKAWRVDNVPIIKFRNFIDYRIEKIQNDKKYLQVFDLLKFHYGVLLRFPTLTNPDELLEFRDRPIMWELIQEHKSWGSIINCSYIGDINKMIFTKEIESLKWVAEGLHDKKIGFIADELIKGFPQKRIVTIAGPSSSGKTTFAKRLAIHIRVNGYTTKVISMDDYFLDREEMIEDENGVKDFESILALNLKLLVERLGKLVKGEKVPERKFNFHLGKGEDNFSKQIQLNPRDFIILEGIHGLNPAFTEMVGLDKISRIYVSALTQLNVDRHHRISTSDNRLLRRMIRDYQYRGWSPTDTTAMWSKVREGEEKYIFPFQEMSDYMFNSALIYELPVLATYLKPLLAEIGGERDIEEEAGRLLRFLSFFYHFPGDRVPGVSIIREFIGNSDFRY